MKILAALAFLVIPVLALAAPQKSDTPADTIHPDIHDKVGQGDGTNANPRGVSGSGGAIHGIGNNPGQSGSHPGDDGTPGQADELETMHGGIGSKNKQAD